MNQQTYNAEASIIGGLMLFPDECEIALEELSPSDFANPLAVAVFEKLLEAKSKNEPVDGPIMITMLEDEETKKYVLMCSQAFLGTSNYDAYIDIIKRESGRRRLAGALNDMLIQGLDYNEAISQLEKLLSSEKKPDKKGDKEYLLEYLEQLYEPVNPNDRIKLGFSTLDRTIGGLRKGSLCYIGAYPSTGKTSFAINAAIRNTGKRILFFSLEMSKDQILDRWMAAQLSLDYDKIDSHTLTEQEQKKVGSEIDRLFSTGNLLIVDDVYSVEAMAGKIARYRPDVVIVDFLQNVRTSGRFQTRKNQVDYISSEVKRLARVNNCAMIVLSQLARPSDDKKSKKPTMTSLKESGNLEADGDYIMLMYRPYVLDKGGQYPPEQTEVLLDKNKYGKCGVVEMRFDGRYQRFSEVETRYD